MNNRTPGTHEAFEQISSCQKGQHKNPTYMKHEKHSAMRHMHNNELQADRQHMAQSTAGTHDKYEGQINCRQTCNS